MSVIVDGSNGLIFNDASTQTTAATGFGFKNRIINGDFRIDQRRAGASYTPSGGDTPVADRWGEYISQASKLTFQQQTASVGGTAGFTHCMGVTVASAVSIAAGDYFTLFQRIEGYNVADLAWGTAAAKTVTLSFLVYSSVTGTFGGSVTNSAYNRSYPFTYTINSANTWETKSVTITGDTAGTWLTTTGIGIEVGFSFGTGSTASGTAGAWTGSWKASATGAVSLVGTSGATWYVTGVQFEKGSTATAFDYRDYGSELQLCQRYCFGFKAVATNTYLSVGVAWSTTTMRSNFFLPVQSRVPATGIVVSAAGDFYFNNAGPGGGTQTSLVLGGSCQNSLRLNGDGASGMTAGYAGELFTNNANAAFYTTGSEL